MRRVVSLLFAASTLAAGPASKPKIVHHTYPQAQRPKATDPMQVKPGYDVPENPERYTWKVTRKAMSKGSSGAGGPVPIYKFAGPGYLNAVSGSLPEGTEVKLEAFRRVNRVILYQVPGADTSSQQAATSSGAAWIDGRFLEPTAYKPPDQ